MIFRITTNTNELEEEIYFLTIDSMNISTHNLKGTEPVVFAEVWKLPNISIGILVVTKIG